MDATTGTPLPVVAPDYGNASNTDKKNRNGNDLMQELGLGESRPYADLAAHFFRRGFEPVPVHGKKPILPSWPVVTINETNISGWIQAGYGDCNVGFRNQPALDLDITHAGLARATEKKLREMLGPLAIRYGKAPKGLVIIQCDAPRKMQSPALVDPATGDICRIEYLAVGQQFVAIGTHPDTETDYWWEKDKGAANPLTKGPLSAPVIRTEQIQELFDWFEKTGVEMGMEVKKKKSKAHTPDATSVGPRSEIRTAIDRFNHDGFDAFVSLLTEERWTACGHGSFEADGETIKTWQFTRPGKDTGVSASLYCSPRTGIWQFQNWSTSVEGLEADTAYIGHVYAVLCHEGDYGRATQALTKMGFEPKRRSAEEDFANLLKQEREQVRKRRQFRFMGEAELLQAPSRPDWRIEGILTVGSLGLIVAPASALKSFLTVSLGAAVASGRPWYGHTVKQGPVAFLLGEGHRGFGTRWLAARMGFDIPNEECLPVFVSTAALALPEKSEAEVLEGVLIEIEDNLGQPPALLVVDTLARNFGGANENENQSMGAFVNNLLGAVHPDTAVVVVHHAGWSDASRMRGGSALHGAADAVYVLERKEFDLKVVCKKQKDAPECDPLAFTAREIIVGVDDQGPTASLFLERADAPTAAVELSESQQAAFDSLCELDQGTGVTLEDWYYAACVERNAYSSKKAFKQAVKKLEAKGLVWNRGGRFQGKKMIPQSGA